MIIAIYIYYLLGGHFPWVLAAFRRECKLRLEVDQSMSQAPPLHFRATVPQQDQPLEFWAKRHQQPNLLIGAVHAEKAGRPNPVGPPKPIDFHGVERPLTNHQHLAGFLT